MLIDAAKGLEPQTLKLFQVCRHRGIPILTVINKWDRPGPRRPGTARRDPRTHRPQAHPADLAGRYRRGFQGGAGPPHRQFHPVHPHRRWRHRGTGGAHRPGARRGRRRHRLDHRRPRSANCSPPTAGDHDQEAFLRGETTPVLFTSAALNFGVNQLLDTLVRLAPPPGGQLDVDGDLRPVDSRRSAPSSSRFRPGWTPPTATGSPTPGSARAPSSAGTC